MRSRNNGLVRGVLNSVEWVGAVRTWIDDIRAMHMTSDLGRAMR